MDVLFITSAHNSLSQRLWAELVARGHHIGICEAKRQADMLEAIVAHRPDLIVAPMLKIRIPDAIWKRNTCLIVHPGIVGDRGPSSLDWALMENEPRWGVTVLQATDEMDAGPIWASREFDMPAVPCTKSHLYRHQVTEAAVAAVLEAVERFETGHFSPARLETVKNPPGRPRPTMTQEDRAIDWRKDDCETATRKIAAADSRPGVRVSIQKQTLNLFGAHADRTLSGPPGALLARHAEAVAVGCAEGAVWITHMQARAGGLAGIKLPAARLLDTTALPERPDAPCREIHYRREGNTGFLSFDFYNGAMGTDQCERLREAWRHAASQPTRALVLEGGNDFFSNGIHLNLIEAAEDPAEESWRNINAMNDLVRDIIATDNQWVVASIAGNAGAGGAVLALAADEVLARHAVVLNPHYRSMGGLYGSEYWTYLLPRRIGARCAEAITRACLPLGARQAADIGLVDETLEGDVESFRRQVGERVAKTVANKRSWQRLLRDKRARRRADEAARPLESYREAELAMMRENFFGADQSYHRARTRFVLGANAARTRGREHFPDGVAA